MIYYVNFIFLSLGFAVSQVTSSQDSNDLNKMAFVLNEAIPKFKELHDSNGFHISEGRPVHFFIYDLIDTTSNNYPATNQIELKENGVYHFSPIRFRFSYSHIAVVHRGRMKIFTNLNCEKNGDKIADVIKYIEDNLKVDQGLLSRVENYRAYGKYFKMDPQSKLIDCP